MAGKRTILVSAALLVMLATASSGASVSFTLDPETLAKPDKPGNGKGGGDDEDGGGGGGSAWPNSMASLGDSITKAFNADSWFDNPQHSWSTGHESGDGVYSHYERILDNNRKVNGNGFNHARSGAEMDELDAQAQNAVSSGAEYVTVLMGANDVCKSDPSLMTDPALFESELRAAAATLKSGLPASTVSFTSIPDVYHLWYIFKDDWWANYVWESYDICQALLDESRTETERQLVRDRNIEFNEIIETVVTEAQAEGYDWHWDGWAGFNYAFKTSEVSGKDYFHPNLNGQAVLAQLAWDNGPYAGQ